jgi:hypothetical protein
VADRLEVNPSDIRQVVRECADRLAADMQIPDPSFTNAVDKILAPLYQDIADAYVQHTNGETA